MFYKKYEVRVFRSNLRKNERYLFHFAKNAEEKYLEQIKLFGYNNVTIFKYHKPYFIKDDIKLKQIREVLENELLSNYPTRNKQTKN